MRSVRYGLSVLSASVLTVPPSLQQPLQCPGHRHQRVERQQVRDQVVVLNKLQQLIADVLGDHSFTAETHPLHEFVERLT